MSQSVVSIIVPVYNAESFLERCVNSLLKQDHPHLEIILVNDGSSDSSPMICDRYAAKHTCVRVIHQKNQGVSAARNAGLDSATGDYVTFLDSDDALFPKGISLLLEAAESHNADMAIGRLVHRRGSKDVEEDFPFEKRFFTGEEYLEATLDDLPLCYYAWRVLYRASLIEGLRFAVGRVISEDSFFVFQCACRKPTVAVIDDPVYIYYTNTASVTHASLTVKKYDDVVALLEQKMIIIRENYPHLADRARNLEVKFHMMLLTNMLDARGREWRKRQKDSLRAFHQNKEHFVSATSLNSRWFRVLNRHMYSPYKIVFAAKKLAKRILKR
ncbi:MAG: glycosyltransferase [Clostridia bacterium]|nr:glycosyltransferase [Clostridia bacterium]